MKNYLLWAASASQSITPPKEENCFWASKATLAEVPLETNPLPARLVRQSVLLCFDWETLFWLIDP